MSLRSWIVPAVLVALPSLLLTGCGASGTPADTSAPTEAPSPTATAEQGSPRPRLAVTCDALIPTDVAAGVVDFPVSLKLGELDVRHLTEAATLQVGMLACTWGGENRTDNSWDQHLEIAVLPDADAAFDVGVWQVDDGAIVYPEGSTTSEYLCPDFYSAENGGSGYYRCFANVLVDGFWAHADVQGAVDAGQTADALDARMRTLVDTLTAVIAGAGPANPEWVPPAGALTGAVCAGSTDDVFPSAPASVAIGRAGVLRCEVGGDRVSILPGGAWALPQIEALGQKPFWSIPVLQPVDVAGADATLVGCGDGCYAMLAIGGSAVEVSSDTMDQASFLGELAPIVAQVAAAG